MCSTDFFFPLSLFSPLPVSLPLPACLLSEIGLEAGEKVHLREPRAMARFRLRALREDSWLSHPSFSPSWRWVLDRGYAEWDLCESSRFQVEVMNFHLHFHIFTFSEQCLTVLGSVIKWHNIQTSHFCITLCHWHAGQHCKHCFYCDDHIQKAWRHKYFCDTRLPSVPLAANPTAGATGHGRGSTGPWGHTRI